MLSPQSRSLDKLSCDGAGLRRRRPAESAGAQATLDQKPGQRRQDHDGGDRRDGRVDIVVDAIPDGARQKVDAPAGDEEEDDDLVPGMDEGEEGAGQYARQDAWHDHQADGLAERGAEIARRLLEPDIEIRQRGGNGDHDIGQAGDGVREDDAGIAVEQTEIDPGAVEAEGMDDCRDDERQQDERPCQLREPRRDAPAADRGERAAGGGDGGRDAGDEEALPDAGEPEIVADDIPIVLERERMLRQREVTLVGERDGDHDEHRRDEIEEQRPGDRQDDAEAPAAEARDHAAPRSLRRSTTRHIRASSRKTVASSVEASIVARPQRMLSRIFAAMYSAIITVLPPPRI